MSAPDQTIPAGNAVLYARVSSEEQKNGYSLDAQIKRCTEYAARNRINIVQTFKIVESAKEPGRVIFDKMMALVRKRGDIQHILVEKIDRLNRNEEDQALLVRVAKTEKKFFHFILEGFVFHEKASPSDFLRLGIGSLFASYFTYDLKEKVKKGMTEMAVQGKWPHKAPYGYRNDPADGVVKRDEAAAPWVTKALELAASGLSLSKIAAKLRSEGCTKKLYPSFIEKIIRNPFYAGFFNWGGTIRHGTYVPIASWELHKAAIRGLERLGKPKGRHRDFPYSGLIRCGLCGRAAVFEIIKAKYVYCRCAGVSNCGNDRLKQNEVDEELLRVVQGIRIDEETAAWVLGKMAERTATSQISNRERMANLQRELTKVEGFLDKGYEDRLAGTLSDDLWRKKSTAWEARKVELTGQIAAATATTADSSNDIAKRLFELAKNLENTYQSATPHDKREILNFVGSNYLLTKKKIEFSYRKPFELLATGSKTQEWSTITDDIRTTLDERPAQYDSDLEKLMKTLMPYLDISPISTNPATTAHTFTSAVAN